MVLFAGGIVIAVGMLGWVMRHRDKHAVGIFGVYIGWILLYNVFSLADLFITSPTMGTLLWNLQGYTRVGMAFTWLAFGLAYAGYGHLLRSRAVLLMMSGAALTEALLLHTPPISTTYAIDYFVHSSPFLTVGGVFTPFAWAVLWAGYLVSFGGTLAIISQLVQAVYTRTWQVIAVIVLNTLLVVIDIVVYIRPLTGIRPPVPGLNLTAIAMSVSLLIYVVVLYRYELFSYTPVARHNVIDTVNEAVVILNPDARIIDYNEAALRMFDPETLSATESPRDRDREREQQASTDYHGREATALLPEQIARSTAVTTASDDRLTVTVDTDGETRVYDTTVSVSTTNEWVDAVAVVIRDITELRERTRDLERQTEQLEQFAGIVSHDLRNPLQVALIAAAQLNEKTEYEEVEDIDESLTRMDEIIDDALTFAREGQAIDDTAWIDCATCIDHAWQTTDARNASLTMTPPLTPTSATTVTVLADESRLQTLFENLFRNAIDHGGEDVQIEVGLLDDQEGFYVADDGPGIPPDDRDTVFKQGYTTSDEGTGFGLAIVASIVDAHGWTIRVTESASGGARFEISDLTVSYD